ncbi:MarR family winged helix-turn-helix transcriptional regulator [Polyangium spumosum]|nr:MarR family winged helix-turn-helix transcriptional regulator [Polyangium spumosum]
MDDAELLRRQVQGFVRGFGLLSESQTPCGKPIPVSQAHALMVLLARHERDDPPMQVEIARDLGLDKSSAARLCARLCDSGHVVRTPCPKDGRAWRLGLTTSGLRLARSIEAASKARFERLLSALPAEKRSSVIASMAALNEAVRNTKSE